MTKNKAVEIQIVPDAGLRTRAVYSNNIIVDVSPVDMSLKFCIATPDLSEDEVEEGVKMVPIIAEIIIPFTIVDGLIKDLKNLSNLNQNNIKK